MPKAPKREYTQEQRDEALHWYKVEGPGAAARRLRIPAATIKSWARSAGIQPDEVASEREAAIKLATLSRKQKREAILEEMHDKVLDLLDRMDAEQIDYKVTKSGELIEIKYAQPPALSVKAYGDTIVNLMNSIRLESGEATSRIENTGPEEFRQYLQGAADAFAASREKAK